MLDSDDNFVEFGTPLEPLEEDEVPSKKPITVADQIAVDEQGRRRFHGAFTGGFSAGYYNTVGSKEGWTPSTFKSSRKDKDKTKKPGASDQFQLQNVQDFMDDEDLGAFGIAPQIIRPTNEFEQKESRKRGRPAPGSTGPIPGMPVLEQIIQPVKDTVGIKILQRMGWRPGQGIGPRLSKKQNKKSSKSKKKDIKPKSNPVPENNDSENPAVETSFNSKENEEPSSKVYGCFVPPELRKEPTGDSEAEDSDLEFELEDFTFPPDDIDNMLCNPKENAFGLGYTGLDRNTLSFGPVDLFGPALKSRVDNKKLNIRGEAFGIGVFEDKDEEVYSRADMSQYDFSLETAEERKAKRLKDKKDKNSRESKVKNKDVLPGFITAKNPPPEKKYYPPPYLPKNFVPMHSIRKSRFDDAKEEKNVHMKEAAKISVPPPQQKKVGLDRHALTIQERQVLLGEPKIPITKAEEEEKTKEDEEKLKREKAERLSKFAEILLAFNTDKKSQSSHHAFKPFMRNPEKQDRYEKYMALVAAGYQECLQDIQPVEMTEWEREREKLEFERAKALYKPISTVMSSRFVSAESHDISHVVPTREVIKEKDPTQDPKVAAKMNLFGKLTHKVFEWHPDRLFSRRMNVPHPYPESKMVGIRRVPDLFLKTDTEEKQADVGGCGPLGSKNDTDEIPRGPGIGKLKKSLFDNLDFSKPPPGLLPVVQQDSSDSINSDMKPQGNENETETEQMQTNTESPIPSRPPIDLFKEIFENSSSEEEENEDSEPEIEHEKLKSSTFHIHGDGKNIEQSTSKNHRAENKYSEERTTKIKGIFDNLDLERLRLTKDESQQKMIGTRDNSESQSERRRNASEINTEKQITSRALEEETEDDIVYGPKPPSSRNNSTMDNNSSSSLIPKFSFSSNKLNSSSQTRDSVNSFPYTSFGTNTNTPTSSHVSSHHHKDEEDEDEWVEIEKSHSKTSTKKKAKQKKKKETHHHSHKSKSSKTSKKKKSKKKHSTSTKSNDKKKKSKKASNFSSSSSDSTTNGNYSEESDDELGLGQIKLNQSLTNQKLLTKLKELTRHE